MTFIVPSLKKDLLNISFSPKPNSISRNLLKEGPSIHLAFADLQCKFSVLLFSYMENPKLPVKVLLFTK